MQFTLQSEDAPHDVVDFLDIHVRIIFADRVFFLPNGDSDRGEYKYDSPELYEAT